MRETIPENVYVFAARMCLAYIEDEVVVDDEERLYFLCCMLLRGG